MNVELLDWREDVVNGLAILAEPVPPLTSDGSDPRDWGLADAVHWVVDDTSWDVRDPHLSIGRGTEFVSSRQQR